MFVVKTQILGIGGTWVCPANIYVGNSCTTRNIHAYALDGLRVVCCATFNVTVVDSHNRWLLLAELGVGRRRVAGMSTTW
mgnify:CR=1 FL=1